MPGGASIFGGLLPLPPLTPLCCAWSLAGVLICRCLADFFGPENVDSSFSGWFTIRHPLQRKKPNARCPTSRRGGRRNAVLSPVNPARASSFEAATACRGFCPRPRRQVTRPILLVFGPRGQAELIPEGFCAWPRRLRSTSCRHAIEAIGSV